MTDENWLATFLEQIDTAIDEYGWACRAVEDTIDDTGNTAGPAFVHTIGLEDRGHPEFVVTGLPAAVATRVVNRLCEWLFDGTRAWPEPGETIHDLLSGGYEVRVVRVDPAISEDDDRFAAAYARRGSRGGFRASQLVWQLADRSWPDDSVEHQPLLGEPWW